MSFPFLLSYLGAMLLVYAVLTYEGMAAALRPSAFLLIIATGLSVAGYFLQRLRWESKGEDPNATTARGGTTTQELTSVHQQGGSAPFSALEAHVDAPHVDESRALRALNHVHEGVIFIDCTGEVMFSNRAAVDTFQRLGLPAPESGSVLLQSPWPGPVRQTVREVLAWDGAGSVTKELAVEQGLPLCYSAAGLSDPDGKREGYVLTLGVNNGQSWTASSCAEFIIHLSHEMRTPITAIRGYAETLLHSPPKRPEDVEQFLEIISRHSERLGRMVDDLLTAPTPQSSSPTHEPQAASSPTTTPFGKPEQESAT